MTTESKPDIVDELEALELGEKVAWALLEAWPTISKRLRAAESSNSRLRQAISDLLMSADCSWYEQRAGHDWPEAVDAAEAVLKGDP